MSHFLRTANISIRKVNSFTIALFWTSIPDFTVKKILISGKTPETVKKEVYSLLPGIRCEGNKRAEEILDLISLYLNGNDINLPLDSLDIDSLGTFDRKILFALRKNVPKGSVISYGALAKLAGCPKAGRAVGNVMRRNPFPLFFPCHRVIRSNKKIGNFQGGMSLKKALLEIEGFFLKDFILKRQNSTALIMSCE